MRLFRETSPNVFAEVTGDLFYGATRIPLGNLQIWSEEARNAVGVYGVPDPVAPSGQIVQDWHVERVNGTVQAVATYAAAPLPHLSFLEFLTLFTQAEQSAIVQSTDADVKLFLVMAGGADYVDLSDPRTVQGVDLLVTKGLIASGRPAQILNNMAPA